MISTLEEIWETINNDDDLQVGLRYCSLLLKFTYDLEFQFTNEQQHRFFLNLLGLLRGGDARGCCSGSPSAVASATTGPLVSWRGARRPDNLRFSSMTRDLTLFSVFAILASALDLNTMFGVGFGRNHGPERHSIL